MKHIIVILNILWCAFSVSAPVFANSISPTLMHAEESAKVLYINAKNRLTRAQSSYVLKRRVEDSIPVYELTSQGVGQYDRYEDIVFTREAKMAEQEGILQVLYSKTVIKDKKGNLVAEYIKTYDYTEKKVIFRRFIGSGKMVERETFKIKGPTCDDVTLAHFLKIYAKNYAQKDYQDFYLVTNEPKKYHVRLIDKGEENLELPIGTFKAKKFQLMADLGPITKWIAKVVPKTHVWYKSAYPHDWLQYEGLERGFASDKIITYPIERSPDLD